MDNQSEVRDFLTSRRERLTPEQAGLPLFGGNRRVKGLRREEVALLAGMSVDYYTRLERGNLSGVSEAVLEGLAQALQLDDAERGHLYDLARASSPASRRKPATTSGVRPATLRMIDAMATVPAYVRNRRFDILATNQLGRALYSPVFESPLFAERGPVNSARFCFLDPSAGDFWPDWDKVADDSVGFLRLEVGRSPNDRVLQQMVGELTTKSHAFSTRWARHDVKHHQAGVKRLRHPLVGELVLPYEAMELSADAGLRINVYLPEPGSAEVQALSILSSWQAPSMSASGD